MNCLEVLIYIAGEKNIMINCFSRLEAAVKNRFSKQRILVIGDLMVDEYITGQVSRISPEAPVPVLRYKKKSMEAGGASNVANNIHALGANVAVSGLASDDFAGRWLRKHLYDMGVDVSGIIAEQNRDTIVKTRFATKGQQLLRVDNEITEDINIHSRNAILAYLREHISGFSAVILSDYKKGVLKSVEFVSEIIQICNSNKVLISIDSKSRNIEAFSGADFVKPNNLELAEAVGFAIKDDEALNRAGEGYLLRSGAKALVVTKGSKGISLFMRNHERRDFPAAEVQVYDVTGAGDTVISTITLGLVSGLDFADAIVLANLAAGKVISSIGTATIKQDELLKAIAYKIKGHKC